MKSTLVRILEHLLQGSLWEWAGLIGFVVLIGSAIWWINRYQASLRGGVDPAENDALLVRHLREMKERGEVSEEEYRSLKSRLVSLPERGLPASPDKPQT